jgi:ketosteroid isomerase-like protein
MKHWCIFLVTISLATGCKTSSPDALIRQDKEFSDLSLQKGMKFAFLKYAADTAVLLQKNTMPVVGKTAIASAFESFSDTGFVLTWEPLYAALSRSGDLGYTYGLYTNLNKTDGSKSRGKYVTIWSKQPDGTWKYVLDGGNEGL